MKTNTLQNKLKKMQLFFKKSLLFEKIIISLHLSLISLVILNFAFFDILILKREKFQSTILIDFAEMRVYLSDCTGKFSRPQERVISP